jgi:hypothetical protein
MRGLLGNLRPPGWMAGALGLPVAGAALTLVLAVATIHPFTTAPLSFDTAASVAYFDRIIAGRHLEAFVTTTPKPLLTLVYGLAYALIGSWQAISWIAIVVAAGAVAAATALAQRCGGLVAGAFCAVVLAGAPGLLWDTALGGGVPWAVLFLAAAGLAMTAVRPHPGLAGFLLMLGALARIEVLVVTAGAIASVAFLEVADHAGWSARHGHRRWLLALGLFALPVMLLHDLLLTGDPLFWTMPSAATSITSPSAVMSPREVVLFLIGGYRAVWPLALLALVGATDLLLRRRWVVAIGLVTVGPGVAAFLVLLAARGIYVSARYSELPDAALRFASALGFAALARLAVRPFVRGAPESAEQGSRRTSLTHAVVLSIGVAVAIVGSFGWGPWSRRLRAEIAPAILLMEHFDRVSPTLAAATAPLLTSADRALPGDYRFRAALPPPRLAVPVLARPRAAVELDLPMWSVGPPPDLRDPATAFVRAPMVVYHDRSVDRSALRPASSYRPFETLTAIRIGAVEVTPIWADPSAGLYVVLVSPIKSPPP